MVFYLSDLSCANTSFTSGTIATIVKIVMMKGLMDKADITCRLVLDIPGVNVWIADWCRRMVSNRHLVHVSFVNSICKSHNG